MSLLLVSQPVKLLMVSTAAIAMRIMRFMLLHVRRPKENCGYARGRFALG